MTLHYNIRLRQKGRKDPVMERKDPGEGRKALYGTWFISLLK